MRIIIAPVDLLIHGTRYALRVEGRLHGFYPTFDMALHALNALHCRELGLR
jgi:hypothetical protein